MAYVVAIISPGEMGSAVAARLSERGVRVTTSLAGRSPASAARAQRAHMVPVADDDALVEEADFFLSICPPGEAIALAHRLKPALTRARKKPIYVDCNAVAPETAIAIGAVLESSGCQYVDGGIIGPPPPPNGTGTRIYVSGVAAHEVARLSEFGVAFPALDGPIGAASALKKELEASQPHLLAWLTRQVPRMYPKAYRWVAEMEEIGHFLQDGTPSGDMFEAVARLYQDIADVAGAPSAGDAIAELSAFFVKPDEAQERKRA